MLITHELLERAIPVCITFPSPWGSLSVAKAEVGGKLEHFIWKTNFKKRFDWDGSFFDAEGEMLRITLNLLHDAGYMSLPEYWKPGDEDHGQPPAWFDLKREAEQHRAETRSSTGTWTRCATGCVRATERRRSLFPMPRMTAIISEQ